MFPKKANHSALRFLITALILLSLTLTGASFAYLASNKAQKNHLKQALAKFFKGEIAWESIHAFFKAETFPDAAPPLPLIPSPKRKSVLPVQDEPAKLFFPSHSTPTEHSFSSCKRKPAALLKKQKIYKWKDSQGRTHFSDQVPSDSNSPTVISKNIDSNDRFTLNLDSRHAYLPAFATDRIKRDVNTVYRVMVSDWALKHVQPIQLNLKLFDSKAIFNRYKEKVAPSLGTAGGFYIPRLQEASVLTYRNKDRMYSVTRHEATHAINHHAYGVMPTWLNEGLAEYFEGLNFQYASHATNSPSKTHMHRLRQAPLPLLADYFQLDRRVWYAEESKSLNYAIAWSLVYFFLSNPERETFFKKLLNHLSENYCEGVNTLKYVNQHYAGEIDQMTIDWHRFLQEKMPMHYY